MRDALAAGDRAGRIDDLGECVGTFGHTGDATTKGMQASRSSCRTYDDRAKPHWT
jgi:hypothetical protein